MNQMSRIVSAAEPATYRARFTTAEFLRMIDAGAFDGIKVELVEGELERMPPPGSRHGRLQISAVALLLAVLGKDSLTGETGIDLGDDTLIGCDLAVLHAPVDDNRMLTPADVLLVIEISISTQMRDLGMKRRRYASAGVGFYWAIDAERSVIHVHSEPLEGEYTSVHTVRFGKPLAVPGTDATITID